MRVSAATGCMVEQFAERTANPHNSRCPGARTRRPVPTALTVAPAKSAVAGRANGPGLPGAVRPPAQLARSHQKPMSDAITADHEHDHEANVLEVIHQHVEERVPDAPVYPTQRDIARAAGLSLGMTNAILKRLAKKGFVTMKHINGRNIHYLVTPEGIEMIAKRSYRYLRRTVGHIVRYKERFRGWLQEQKEAGIDTIVFVGPSDLDFLVEWCVEAEGMHYTRHSTTSELTHTPAAPHTTVILSEQLGTSAAPTAPLAPTLASTPASTPAGANEPTLLSAILTLPEG